MMNSRPTRKPEGRGPFLKLRRMIAGVAASKPFLITVSALAAIVCWSALVASDGTLTRQKTFANVAVTVTGEAALKSRGYIVMDDILEKVPAVKMTVEVTQAYVDQCVLEHSRGELSAVDAAKAKWWTAQVQNDVLDACVQLWGGYGFMNEYRVARAWRDARVTKIWAGSNEIMKELIGRDLGL